MMHYLGPRGLRIAMTTAAMPPPITATLIIPAARRITISIMPIPTCIVCSCGVKTVRSHVPVLLRTADEIIEQKNLR